jgi:hypothetical protein
LLFPSNQAAYLAPISIHVNVPPLGRIQRAKTLQRSRLRGRQDPACLTRALAHLSARLVQRPYHSIVLRKSQFGLPYENGGDECSQVKYTSKYRSLTNYSVAGGGTIYESACIAVTHGQITSSAPVYNYPCCLSQSFWNTFLSFSFNFGQELLASSSEHWDNTEWRVMEHSVSAANRSVSDNFG